MGMYTEVHFRGKIKDGPVADWLNTQINGEDDWLQVGFNDHEFFALPRWKSIFIGGGAVYQYSTTPKYRPARASYEDNWLALHSSLKNYGGEFESFIDWIAPHLDMYGGDFLGYELYEETRDEDYGWGGVEPIEGGRREHPTLYFYNCEPVRS
ncbi:hypothetical protein [Mycobacterium sp. CnD-18-1]|uniref:hypothetical protein n=1 Tax=Mycobacterium sp. CnD-18-1 TaxID=2917744 RepID=UPI001EF2B953|nr:hypothetical protein [Mycobacterium sp. CnD-18-1]MCG7607144.1 hypothetical protein [Mycobacterium sp. CnD-18-1]